MGELSEVALAWVAKTISPLGSLEVVPCSAHPQVTVSVGSRQGWTNLRSCSSCRLAARTIAAAQRLSCCDYGDSAFNSGGILFTVTVIPNVERSRDVW